MKLGRIVLTLNHPPTANFMLNKWHKQRIRELICRSSCCGNVVNWLDRTSWEILPKHWVAFKKHDLVSFCFYFLHLCSLCHKKTV